MSAPATSGGQIIVSARDGTPCLALLEDGRPVELRWFDAEDRPFAGETLSARVTSVAREIDAAFLSGAAGDLLLPFERARTGARGRRPRSISDCVREGEDVTVMVTREAEPADNKLAMVRLAEMHEEPAGLAGLIADMAARTGGGVTIDERRLYLAVKRAAGTRGIEGAISLWTGKRNLFEEYGVAEVIEDVADGCLALPSGGSLRIEPTRTLTAIDVNTGRADRGRDAARTKLRVNIEAAKKIAWALRFLDIGGLLVIDFVNMKARADRQAVLEALDVALAGDPGAPRRTGFSSLGLVEMTRQKRGPSLLQRRLGPTSESTESGT